MTDKLKNLKEQIWFLKNRYPSWETGLIFDVDGTLYSQKLLRFYMLQQIAVAFFMDPVKMYKNFRILKIYRKELELLRRKPRVCKYEQFTNTKEKSGYAAAEVNECLEFWFNRVPLKYIKLCARKDLLQLIDQCRKNKIRLGIYSDYKSDQKLKMLDILHCFDVVACSTDDGIQSYKPNAKGFIVTAEKLGVKKDKIIYVGDRYDVDGIGAQKAGLNYYLIK